MKLLLVGVIIVLVTPTPVFAEDGIIERYQQFMAMLDTQYINNMSDLPTDIDMTPNSSIMESGRINVRLDIAGYRGMLLENGVYYIHGNPANLAVVKYDVHANLSDCPSIIPGGCGVNAIYTKINVTQSGNQTIARLDVVLYWYYISCGIACIKIERPATATFFDYEAIPTVYPELDRNTSVDIDIFNNTFEPKTTVAFRADGASRTNVSYRGSSLTHFTKIIRVDYTNESIPYGNVTDVDFWNKTGDEVSHIGDVFVINGTAEPEDIRIEVSNPYGTVRLTNYSVHRGRSETFTPLFIPFVSILIIIFGAISRTIGAL